MRWISLVLAALCAACGPGGDNRPADTVIVNGKIFTGAPEIGEVEALAIRDGRVLVAGTKEEARARAGNKTVTIDAEGRRVVPGLTDAHVHITARPEGTWLDLGGGATPDPDPEAVLAAVKSEASRPGGRGWIYATVGAAVLDDRSLRRSALDKASPGRPVMLTAYSGHGTILNTRGLKMLGVDEDNDPPGGWCERDGAGRCTGFLREMAEFAARRRLRMSAPVSRTAEAYRQAGEAYLRWGVTAIHEMALSHTVERTVAALAEARIPLRWSIYRGPILSSALDEAWADDFAALKLPDKVRIAGIKWILDGTPIERDAAMRSDYADRKGWQGRLNFTPEQIRRILMNGLERGEQIALHISGDRTLETVLKVMRDVAPPETWRRHRLRVEHGDGLQSDLMDAAAELGVVLVQNPLHFAPTPQVTEHLTKDQRASFQKVSSALKKGIPLALGADADGAGRNPYLNMMMAATHPLNPVEALTVRQALTAYARGGAYAEQREGERGTLEPGRLADLAILSQDILEVPVDQLPATESILTMVGGEIVYRKGNPDETAKK